jgi:hypothetical protein
MFDTPSDRKNSHVRCNHPFVDSAIQRIAGKHMKTHYMSTFSGWVLAIFAGVILNGFAAANSGDPVPQEVQRFVESETHVAALGSADINGDGRIDYVLVLEKDNAEGDRTFLILIRLPDHSLKLAVRNDTVALCRIMQGEGGGIDVVAHRNTFEIRQTIGSGAGGGVNILIFRYSKKDRDWLLTHYVRESHDNTGFTEKTTQDVSARHVSIKEPMPEEFEGGCHV